MTAKASTSTKKPKLKATTAKAKKKELTKAEYADRANRAMEKAWDLISKRPPDAKTRF